MNINTEKLLFCAPKTIDRDSRMELISASFNIAQFISCGSDLRVRKAKLRSPQTTAPGALVNEALSELFAKSESGIVNLRFFAPGRSTGAFFAGEFKKVDDAIQVISGNVIVDGGYGIASEAIDLFDGGVSGVLSGNIVEFLQGVTPRFVDECKEPVFPQMNSKIGEAVLRSIYGPDVQFGAFCKSSRVEFSVHPTNVGTHRKKLIVWDCYDSSFPSLKNLVPFWPNCFSEWLGDKLFGELLASCSGYRVPKTKAYLHPKFWDAERGAVAQWVPPDGIAFGDDTGDNRIWIRSAPRIRRPGLFPTYNKWQDPIKVMLSIDPSGKEIGSCLVQQNVRARFSGSARVDENDFIVEGVAGSGEGFMVGGKSPEPLPDYVQDKIIELAKRVLESFGPSTFEWAYDEDDADWLLQVNPLVEKRSFAIELEQTGISYLYFDPDTGLLELEILAKRAQAEGMSILLSRPVGLTSHICEILNSYQVPFAMRRN